MIKKAFTLAEVLITLVIIGVIASITVPSLNNAMHRIQYNSALKKNFSILSNVFNNARADYDDYLDWNHADSNQNAIFENYYKMKPYMVVIRECNDRAGCWSKDVTKKPDGKNSAMSATEKGIGGNIVTFTLNDGTNVNLDYWSAADITANFGVSRNLFPYTLSIFVDVNGDKRPNVLGKDVYAFILTTEGLVPAGADNNSANCNNTGYDCTAKYLYK